MASAVDSRLAYARLSAVATASRLPTANRGSNNSYTTSWDTTPREVLEAEADYLLIVTNKELGASKGTALASMYPEATLEYPNAEAERFLPRKHIYVLAIDDFERRPAHRQRQAAWSASGICVLQPPERSAARAA